MPNYQHLSDEQLLFYLKKDDHAAFTEIYNRHWEEMANAAYQRLRCREDAEEVVQEVFFSLYMRRYDISLKTSLLAYLKTALKYKVIDAYRLQQLHQKHLHSILVESSSADSLPDDKLHVKELQQDIMEIVEKLPSKCRQVFLKSRFEHLSHQCIANNMGISISTVKKHIYKATETLRKELGKKQSELLIIFLFLLSQKK